MSPGGWGTPRKSDPKPPPVPPRPSPKGPKRGYSAAANRIYAEFAACGFPQPGKL